MLRRKWKLLPCLQTQFRVGFPFEPIVFGVVFHSTNELMGLIKTQCRLIKCGCPKFFEKHIEEQGNENLTIINQGGVGANMYLIESSYISVYLEP